MVVDQGDDDRALADGRRNALDRPVPEIAHRNDTRNTGLERHRRPLKGPTDRWPAVIEEVTTGHDVASVVDDNLTGEPSTTTQSPPGIEHTQHPLVTSMCRDRQESSAIG